MRGALRNVALLLAVSAFAFGIVEGVARYLTSGLLPLDYRSVEAKGYGVFVPAPNQDLVARYEDLDRVPFGETPRKLQYRIVTDANGQRISERAGVPLGKKRRIALVGDSFSFGAHAEYERSLAGRLQAGFPQDAVFDFAVGGTSSYEYPGILRYFLARSGIQPDVLVVGIYVDLQIGDIPRRLAREQFGPYHTWNGYIVGPSRHADLESSTMQQILFWFQTTARANLATFNLLLPPAPFSEFAVNLSVAEAQPAIDRYRPLLARTLLDLGAAAGLSPRHIVVWLIPSNHEVNNEIYPANFNQTAAQLHAISRNFWNDEVEILRKAGYAVVDPRPDFARRVKERVRYPFTVDGHFNEQGFALVADLVALALRDRCQEC